jgi:cell division protease FtsH
VSEATQEVIDFEVRRIIEEAHQEVRNLIERERERLDSLAKALLERETLDQDEAYAAAGLEGRAVSTPA